MRGFYAFRKQDGRGFARIMQEAGRRLSEIIVYEIYAPELKPIADAAPK
jgi:hypothetical protein